MSTTRPNRYQEGSIDRISRAKGPDVWVSRWRELQDDGSRVQRKKTIGNVDQYPKKADVKRESRTSAQRSMPKLTGWER